MGGGQSTSQDDIRRVEAVRKRNMQLQNQRMNELGRKIQAEYANKHTKEGHRPRNAPQGESGELSDNQHLSKFTKAAQDFINNRQFKQLAREKNLNLQGKLIHSKVSIDLNSIKFEQDLDNRSLYWLSLKYSASEKSKISIYY